MIRVRGEQTLRAMAAQVWRNGEHEVSYPKVLAITHRMWPDPREWDVPLAEYLANFDLWPPSESVY